MSPFSTLGVFIKSDADDLFFKDIGSMIVTAVELPQIMMPGAGASHKAIDGATRVHYKGDLRLDIAAIPGAEVLAQLRQHMHEGRQLTIAIALLADKFLEGKHSKVVAEIYELRGVTIASVKPHMTKQNDQVVYTLVAPIGSIFHIAFAPNKYPSVENFK